MFCILDYVGQFFLLIFFFSSRRRHTRLTCDWSSDVCSSDLRRRPAARSAAPPGRPGCAWPSRARGRGSRTRRRSRTTARRRTAASWASDSASAIPPAGIVPPDIIWRRPQRGTPRVPYPREATMDSRLSRRRLLQVSALAALAPGVPAAWAQAPKKGGTLRVGFYVEAATMDPHLSGSKIDRQVYHNIYEPLVVLDDKLGVK